MISHKKAQKVAKQMSGLTQFFFVLFVAACFFALTLSRRRSIGGGWLSSSLIKRGWTINAGRKLAMLICALAVVPIVFAAVVGIGGMAPKLEPAKLGSE